MSFRTIGVGISQSPNQSVTNHPDGPSTSRPEECEVHRIENLNEPQNNVSMAGSVAWMILYTKRPNEMVHRRFTFDPSIGKQTQTTRNSTLLLHELTHLVRSRIRLLCEVDRITRNSRNPMQDIQSMLREVVRNGSDSANMVQDDIAHYLCRLAMCHKESHRLWLCQTECALFRARCHELSVGQQKHLFTRNRIVTDESVVTTAQLDASPLLRFLTETMQERWSRVEKKQSNTSSSISNVWYLVSFKSVLEAVRRRDVVCVGGKALVRHPEVLTMLHAAFQQSLRRGLGEALQQRLRIEEAASTYSIEQNNKSASGSNFTSLTHALSRIDAVCDVELQHYNATDTALRLHPASELNPEKVSKCILPKDVPMLAASAFPLCMAQLFDQLERDRHLKFHGRWQFGTFLKRIGMSLEDSIEFFGNSDAMGLESFRKSSYAYSIRHYYGKEGKHTQYSAMSCTSIIHGAPPSTTSCHGCPFRFDDEVTLRRKLCGSITMSHPTAMTDIEDIVGIARAGHFTKACTRHFQLRYSSQLNKLRLAPPEGLFITPAQYFEASLAIHHELSLEPESSTAHSTNEPRTSLTKVLTQEGTQETSSDPTKMTKLVKKRRIDLKKNVDD